MTELELQSANENSVVGKSPDAYVRIAVTTRYDPTKRAVIGENSWIRAYCKAEAESVNHEEKV